MFNSWSARLALSGRHARCMRRIRLAGNTWPTSEGCALRPENMRHRSRASRICGFHYSQIMVINHILETYILQIPRHWLLRYCFPRYWLLHYCFPRYWLLQSWHSRHWHSRSCFSRCCLSLCFIGLSLPGARFILLEREVWIWFRWCWQSFQQALLPLALILLLIGPESMRNHSLDNGNFQNAYSRISRSHYGAPNKLSLDERDSINAYSFLTSWQ